MLELILSLLLSLFVFATVDLDNQDNQDKQDDNDDKDKSNKDDEDAGKNDNDDKGDKADDDDEDDVDISEPDNKPELEKLFDKKFSELTEDEFDLLFNSDEIDADKLLEAIKTKDGKEKLIKDLIEAKDGDEKKKKSDIEPGTKNDKKEGNASKVNLVEVNGDYIRKFIADFKEKTKDASDEQVEALKEILKGIEGDQLTPRALQNYVNAQLYIKEIKSPLDKDWKLPETEKTEEYLKKAEETKIKTLAAKIREQFPDYPDPTDEEAVVDFEESLSRRDYQRYMELKQQEEKRISETFDRYFYIANNWEKIAIDTLKGDIQMFEKKLNEVGLKPSDLGLDLSLDQEGYNKFIYDNILFRNGKIDNKLVNYIADTVPVLEPLGVYNRLLDLFLPDIIELAKSQGKTAGYKEAVKDIPEPGTHLSKGVLDNEEELTLLGEGDVDDEYLDKVLNKVKKKILKGV